MLPSLPITVHWGRVVAANNPLLAATADNLGAADVLRLSSLRQQGDRQRFLTGRAMIASMLRERGIGPRDYAIARPAVAAGDSKPFLIGGGGGGGGSGGGGDGGAPLPRISLSHSGSVVLLAECDSAEVGIDVEAVSTFDDMPDAALEIFLDEAELRILSSISAAQRADALCRVFTRKEAVLKAIGFGFAIDPRCLRLSGPYAPPAIVHFADARAVPLALAEVALDGAHGIVGYRAALASSAERLEVTTRAWGSILAAR